MISTPAIPIIIASVVVSVIEIDEDPVEDAEDGITGAREGTGVANDKWDTAGTTLAVDTIKLGTLITIAKCCKI